MYKQTIIIRTDLKMSAGKLAAQASHASLSSYLKVAKKNPDLAKKWEAEGQKKIVLKVEGEKELFENLQKAKDAGIPCEVICDAGRTQLEPGTHTCFGAGPWDEKTLDALFGKLKLL